MKLQFACLFFCLTATATANLTVDTTPPLWMRHAVIYGIKPSGFTDSSSYKTILKKLPELKELGINTIWLQPVFKTKQGGQGYDIIDFFSLREDIGKPEDLKQLINTAHQMKIRILFDFVPNHTSSHHPYALDIIAKGKASEYYDYYQHDMKPVPYSSYYNRDSSGFIYYFWKSLFNLNFNNEKVRKMIIDACVFWVKNYDIDGYRMDAVWAVNARWPEFGTVLRRALKNVKKDVLLLAEDKGADESLYAKGYDAAYDWTSDTAWVSHWSWQYKHHERENFSVFNHPDVSQRHTLLRAALFSNLNNTHRILRFIENNDLPRFINAHSLQQTKMAAELLFALPGIPLIYNGQEVGVRPHPYSRRAIFTDSLSIREKDSFGLFDHYRNLIKLRLKFSSLTSRNIAEVKTKEKNAVIAFHRWEGKEHFLVLINLDSVEHAATLELDQSFLNGVSWYDVLKKNEVKIKPASVIKIEGYSTRWFLVSRKGARTAVSRKGAKETLRRRN